MKKKFTLSKTLITATITAAIVVIGSSSVKENQSLNHAAGSSVSGSSGGCSCHTKGVAPGGVTLVGLPSKLQVGSVDTFTLHVDNNKITAMKWGFAMKATGGVLSSVNTNVGKATTGALYHKTAFSSTGTTYDIVNLIVTAPATPGTVLFTFAAMAGTNASGSTGHGYHSTLSVPVVDSTLPISLASFSANLSANKVNLAWTSLTEKNVSYFAVQRSVDGVNFATVGKVTAAGNSTSTRSYAYVDDASKLSGTVYYRLNTVDKDGKNAYSAVKQIQAIATKNQLINIYPNPLRVGQDLKLAYTSLKSERVSVQVVNMLGRRVVNTNLSVTEGINALSVSVGHLSAGVYSLSVISESGSVQKQQLVIQ